MSDDLTQLNIGLKAEADTILNGLGLYAVLEKSGKPTVVGSYSLDTMTWRDLDIYLECNDMTEANHFRLGGEIAGGLHPERMSYRNEIVKKTPGLPVGLYWGVYTAYTLTSLWKIDIWCIDSAQVQDYLRFMTDLASRITTINRQTIMSIKRQTCSHSEYRRKIKSLDIYQAVLDEGITTIEEFSVYLQKQGIEVVL